MMWPFTRKVCNLVREHHDPEPVVQAMARRVDAARNERSDTVAAFLKRMRDLRYEVEIEPDLPRRKNGHGHAD